MKNNKIILHLLSMVLTFSMAHAHDQELHKGKSNDGTITRVESNSFDLKSNDKNFKVGFDNKTNIETNGKTGTAADIQANRVVKVFGIKLPGGKIHAKEILIEADQANHHSSNDGPLSAYLDASEALASDDSKSATLAFDKLGDSLEQSKDSELKSLASKLDAIGKDSNLEEHRKIFGEISEKLISKFEGQQKEANSRFKKAFCPMALNNKGGYWLQRSKQIRNPYFGASMLACGEIVNTAIKDDHEEHEKHDHSQGHHH